MGEHKIPREERFQIFEPETGVRTAIREASDEMLARHERISNEATANLTKQVMDLLNQATSVAKAHAIIAYEIDRRSRSLVIASTIPSRRQ